MVHEGLSRGDAETLASWTEAARDRGPVLFVGAGWTRNADPSPRTYDAQAQDQPLPLLWSELAEKFRAGLEHEIGDGASLDPLWLAELYRQRYGEDALMILLRQAVPDEQLRPGVLHDALRAIPWRAILTTNYDTLLQRTFSPHQRVRVCVDDVDLVRSSARDAVELIHLHGILDRPETIVLALEDYRRYPTRHPGLLAKVRQLLLQHPVLFVGFGITDPNFMQWSGWLADVVGDGKNPWVNVTLDPAPTLSHARYWGTRLNFVSVQKFPRFRAVVPHVLKSLGEALDDDERRSEDVARLRLRATRSIATAIHEAGDLLRTGALRGAEGEDWDRFRIWLFNAAASHVLDLGDVPWREVEPTQQETGLKIVVDARPPAMRERNEDLVAAVLRAFGTHWEEWAALLRSHVGQFWTFERIDLTERRPSDVANMTPIPLVGKDTAPPPDQSTESTGDLVLDALRAGDNMPSASQPAATAREHRINGFLAYQRGQIQRAAAHYESAASASRSEREPLRREWLTLRSQQICLDATVFRERDDDRVIAKAKLEAVQGIIRKVRDTLRRLPREEGVEPLFDDEIDAESKLAAQLVSDLDRDDVDTTARFGHVYGRAEQWLDRLERLFVVPPMIADAADALGTLQWRYGDWTDAARTLGRYGSKRLKIIVGAIAKSPDLERPRLNELIGELVRAGRWPGEWIARAEALLEVLPSCTEAQIEAVGKFARDAHAALPENLANVVRGSSSERLFSARSTILRLESRRWQWLEATAAIESIEHWIERHGKVPSHVLHMAGVLRALDQLPWRAWVESGSIERTRVEALLVRLADARLAAPRDDVLGDEVGAILNIVFDLVEAGVVRLPEGSPTRATTKRLAETLDDRKREPFSVALDRVDGNLARVNERIDRTVAEMDPSKHGTIRSALDVVAAGRTCSPASLPKVVEALRELRVTTAKRLAEDQGSLRDWTSFDEMELVGFVLGRLFSNCRAEDRAQLEEEAKAAISTSALAAEYLLGAANGNAELSPAVSGAINRLFHGAEAKPASRRQQKFAALRSVTRALVQVGPQAIPDGHLANVAALAHAEDRSEASYAAWILSEFVFRSEGREDTRMASIVEPALLAAAADRRVEVRSKAARGLTSLQRIHPSEEKRMALAELGADLAIGVRRALAGNDEAD
jgi:hypothetical protein